MEKKDEYILHGPEPHQELCKDSVGKEIFRRLKQYLDLPEAMVDAITQEKRSYRNLLDKSCRLAESLKSFGLVQNDVIAICSENNLDYFYPVLAAMYLGIVVTAFNPNYTAGEIIHMANISKPKIIFCSETALKSILKVKPQAKYLEKIILLDTKLLSTKFYDTLEKFITYNTDRNFNPNTFKPIDLDVGNQIAFILYSSGTTGFPKGVMITHRNINVLFSINSYDDDPRYMHTVEPGTKAVLALLPFFHSFGLFTTITALVSAMKIVVLKKFETNVFLKTVQDYKISVLLLVPTLANILAKTPLLEKYDLSNVLAVTCGAAPLSKDIEEILRKRIPSVKLFRQVYGMTEITSGLTTFPMGEYKAGSCGKLLPHATVKVIDPETGKTLGPGLPGEICVKGPSVMKGYAGDSQSTAQIIDRDGWLSTGDVGYYDEQGYFYIVDRLKELIKYRGFQVAPAELEALLLSHSKIEDVGVVGLPDEDAGELPLAFVVLKPGEKFTEAEIQKFVADRISQQKWLRGGVRFVKEIPKNATGKILRRKLRELLHTSKSKL